MVFERKLDNNGQMSRYKSRLLAKVFFQTEEIDYLKSFVPLVSIEILLSLVGKFVLEE